MVDDYRLERGSQLDALEDGRPIDEQAEASVIVFRTWLQHFPWPPAEVVEYWSTDLSSAVA
jgi:hypothetical protein